MKLFVREKAFYKKVWELSAPISAQQVITVGVNMMDTIMLGQLNETALAASAVGTQVHNFYHFMSMAYPDCRDGTGCCLKSPDKRARGNRGRSPLFEVDASVLFLYGKM